MLGDHDARLWVLWGPREAAGKGEVVAEDKGEGELVGRMCE